MSETVYLVPFSHMDLFWLGEREECLSRGNRVIAEALRIARADPQFRFLLEDAVFVAHFLACHPERQDELSALVRAGQIEVGPKWAGIFQNLSDEESLVRNLVLGIRFSQETFGTFAPTIHLGDLPGYTPQFPQIAAKAGLRFAIITRSGPRDLPLFRWRSPDGTEILTWNALDSYAWARNLQLHVGADLAIGKGLAEQARTRLAQTGHRPVLMHWGVDLILPTENLPGVAAQVAEKTGLEMILATPTAYAAALDGISDLPVREGEIPSAWPFAEPCHLHAVGKDLETSRALLAAERFSVIASLLGFATPSQATLDEAWKLLIEAMDHNNDGQGWVGSARRKADFHHLARQTAEATIRRALHPIAENVGGFPEPDSHAVVVFNPLAWERTEPVEGHSTFYGNPESFRADDFRETALVDAQGKDVPYQLLEAREGVSREISFVFIPSDVPSLGYRTYYFVPRRQPMRPDWPIVIEDTSVTAGRFRLSVNPAEATFTVDDLVAGRSLVRGIGLLGLEEREDNYYFKTATTGEREQAQLRDLKLVERGPIRLRWQAHLRLLETDFVLGFNLYAGLDRIDVDMKTVWEHARPVRVLLRLPVALAGAALYYGVPFGDVAYPEIMADTGPFRRDEIERDAWQRFREVQGWLDLSIPGYGVGIASSVRSFELEPPLVSAVVLRGSPSLRTVRVDGQQRDYLFRTPEGPVHVALSLYPHAGDWRQAHIFRRGWEQSMPLRSVAVADPSTPKTLPPSQSFLSLEPANLVLTAFKREGDGSLLLRAYEATGEPSHAWVHSSLPLENLRLANLLGEVVEGAPDPMRVGARAIATWRTRIRTQSL